jgi:hypothetical protein
MLFLDCENVKMVACMHHKQYFILVFFMFMSLVACMHLNPWLFKTI